MGINKGALTLNAIKIGSTDVNKVMKGTVQI
jgi:hypothetical protein